MALSFAFYLKFKSLPIRFDDGIKVKKIACCTMSRILDRMLTYL